MVACMAVMAREAWTDERLDDLVKQIDKGFGEAKLEIRDLRADMDKGFDEVKEDAKELRAAISALNSRFDSMQQTMVVGFISLFVGIAACVIGGLLGAITLT